MKMKEKFSRLSKYIRAFPADVDCRNLFSLTVLSWVFFVILAVSHISGIFCGEGGSTLWLSFAATGAELMCAILLTLVKGSSAHATIWIFAGGYVALAGAILQFAAFGNGRGWLFALFLVALAGVLTLPLGKLLWLFLPPSFVFLYFAVTGGGAPAAELPVSAVLLAGSVAALSAFFRIQEGEKREKACRMASTDALTGVGNRYAFEAGFRAMEKCRTFALAVMDLDHFKEINDHIGHVTGDAVLVEFCRFTEQYFADCQPKPLFARLGGDEFALLFARVGDENALIYKMEAFCAEIRKSAAGSGAVSCSCSVGMVFAKAPGYDCTRALAAADRELYRAKCQRGATVCTARL